MQCGKFSLVIQQHSRMFQALCEGSQSKHKQVKTVKIFVISCFLLFPMLTTKLTNYSS